MSRDYVCTEILMISTEDILEPAFPVRTVTDESGILGLAASIKAKGLIQPIGVEQLPDGRYRRVFGGRRLKAVKLAGGTEIPAMVLPPKDTSAMAIIENVQREDLSVRDLAVGLWQLTEVQGLSQEQAAESIGKDKSYVSRTVKVGRLFEEFGGTVSLTKLPLTVLWELVNTPELLSMAADGKWTQQRARKEAKRILDRRSARELGHLGDDSFEEAAGSQPARKSNRNRGANASSPIELFRGGFIIHPFTFQASSSQDIEAVTERMEELCIKIESVIYVLRQFQAGGKDGKRLLELDFEGAFLGQSDESSPVEQL